MKTFFKLLTCLAITSSGYAGDVNDGLVDQNIVAKSHKHCCENLARKVALAISDAIDQTFHLLVPATAEQGAAAFTSFFAEDAVVFQSPGGILRGKTEIFDGFLAYAQDPGEMNQHVFTRKSYWDPETATLTLERTWYATLTEPADFCGTTLPAGFTYSQDDAVIIRYSCAQFNGCIVPGLVVYYREYFDPCQFVSNFTDEYPAPCAFIGD